jgi:hypothetical protein
MVCLPHRSSNQHAVHLKIFLLCWYNLILGPWNAAIIYPFLQQLEGNLMDKDCKEKGWCTESGGGRKLVADDDREDECGICLETCTKMVLPNCNHAMCINCYRDWYCSLLLLPIRLRCII